MIGRSVIRVPGSQRAFIAPGKYVQGDGVIAYLDDYMKEYGKRPCRIVDKYVYELLGEQMGEIQKENLLIFEGQVSVENIERYICQVENGNCDVIAGIGGGRTLDTAKVIANRLGVPLVIVPTSAATDAPTSALSVIYTESGKHVNEIFYKKCPDLVLVDTEVIAQSPVRLLVAGMGDALATFFEARANKESDSCTNIMGNYKLTLASYAIAKECYAVLLEDGYAAKLAAERNASSKALQNIVEVNTLLSGVGAESNGASGAHAFHDGFTALRECQSMLHGERVAFGVICQLVLENRSKAELMEVLAFCMSVGLPITMEEIGVAELDQEKIGRIAAAVKASPLIEREPFEVTEEMIMSAVLAADAIGTAYKQNAKGNH